MKKHIEVLDYTETILKAVKRGVLLTTTANGKLNTMAISWGTIGIEWGRILFTTFVRTGRFTRELLDKNGEFTVNIPMQDSNRSLIGKCGTCSGRDVDKFKQFRLTPEIGEQVTVPGIREYPLTLECRVIYRQEQDKSAMPAEVIAECYPENVGSENWGANRDIHIAYVGEIVNAYIIENEDALDEDDEFDDNDELNHVKCGGRILDEDDFDKIDDEDE
jgi:flavin reductase (DIM6/NTAB) family NADH-FMN oxidoreductase RutF